VHPEVRSSFQLSCCVTDVTDGGLAAARPEQRLTSERAYGARIDWSTPACRIYARMSGPLPAMGYDVSWRDKPASGRAHLCNLNVRYSTGQNIPYSGKSSSPSEHLACKDTLGIAQNGA
jgi:hypothetical protein